MPIGIEASLAPGAKVTVWEPLPVKSTPPGKAVPLAMLIVTVEAEAQQTVRVREGATTAVPPSFIRKADLVNATDPEPLHPVTGQVSVSHAAPVYPVSHVHLPREQVP